MYKMQFPGGQWLKTSLSDAAGMGLIPGWGARSCAWETKYQNINRSNITNSIKTNF